MPLSTFAQRPENAVAEAFSPYREIYDWGDVAQWKDADRIPEDKQRELIHGYYACISYVDAQIGKVLQALKDNGLEKNTIVVLAGDHGWHLGDHNLWAKHTNFEQAVNVPFMIMHPGIVSSVYEQEVEFVDIYPTLCAMTGVAPKEKLDGCDLTLAMKEGTKVKNYALSQYPRSHGVMGYTLRSGEFRYTVWLKHSLVKGKALEASDVIGEELYDYCLDPQETVNHVNDPAYAETLLQMRAFFAEHQKKQKTDALRHQHRWLK